MWVMSEENNDDKFRSWIQKYKIKESSDYDLKAAFNAGAIPDSRGHLTSQFKLPNHITYSYDSVHANEPDSPPPGRWDGSDKTGWTFYASPTNIKNAGGIDKLQDYFKREEPTSKLILPPINPDIAKARGGAVHQRALGAKLFGLK